MTSALQDRVSVSRETTDEIRRQRKAIKLAQPEIWLYKNDPTPNPGLLNVGRLDVADLAQYTFPKKKNVSAAGSFKVRANHWLAKYITSVPNDPNECKNIIIRVDLYGGRWRWTGMLHHWQLETLDGVDYLTAFFNDDMQMLQFMLGPPNPLLPIDVFQFPRDWPMFGPSIWCISTFILLQIFRKEGNLYQLPDDPFDLAQWLEIFDLSAWQLHVKSNIFIDDSSLWTFIASRMNTVDSVIADALDDGQLCLDYRRIFTAEGETVTGLLDNNVANGALVFEITDKSGFTLPGGTFFNGTALAGLARSVLTFTDGFVEDTLTMVTDDESIRPEQYYQSGFLGSFASSPGICVRDSFYNDLQSKVTYSPATAASVIVGGDNPTADAIVKLIIETTGNLLGYFLLGGFDSLGDIIDDVVQPFLNGTILAWVEWKNTGRATNLGWVHLLEVYQSGAENNAWSLAALAALRGGFTSTEAQTSHTMVITDSTWLIPGLHFELGDRIASTSGALMRQGIDVMFVDQVEETNLQGTDVAHQFVLKIGQNKAAMTQGERASRLLNKALMKIQDIGVRLIS